MNQMALLPIDTTTPLNRPFDSDYRLANGICSGNLHYYGRYFGDPRARLFWNEEKLFLGIVPPFGRSFSELLNSHQLDKLFERRLLFGVERMYMAPSGFDAVYRLDSTPRITYWHEWSRKMWRAAALRLIALLSDLAEQGLTVRNLHPWNLLFDGQQFSYANPGSIVPLEADTFARSYEKLARFFIRPLILSEHGSEHIARRLNEDPRDGVLMEDVGHLDCVWAEWDGNGDRHEILLFLEELASEVESMSGHSSSDRWIDYFATDCDFGPGTSWTRKQDVLRTLLEDAGIRTVLDLGSNAGHYAQLAAQSGRQVFAADVDPALVDILFERTQESGISLYPLVLDFTHPTAGRGIAYRWFPPVTERIMSDLVLCFALAHHMVFGKYRLDFDQVACGVRNFSRAWALVEYVERGNIQPALWRPDADGWYSVEEFARAFGRYFRSVQILPPALDGRQLLLCGPDRRQL